MDGTLMGSWIHYPVSFILSLGLRLISFASRGRTLIGRDYLSASS